MIKKQNNMEIPIKVHPTAILIGVLVIMALMWAMFAGPAYTVAPDELGVVLTFGHYTATSNPGFHMKWPWPIQTVETPKVAEVKRIEIGFRSSKQGGDVSYQTFLNTPLLLQEAEMLTGDENVVDCSMAVQYRIKNALDYLFNFRQGEAESTLRAISEAALRQAVGDHPIDDVLTTGKVEVQDEIREKMQELSDLFGMGVTIVAVQLQDVQPPQDVAVAFRDVATAREEREKIINEAQAYARERIPKAEGEAARILQEAEGYKQSRIAEAQGEIARFISISKQYDAAPEMTRTRLYLDTMSAVLPRIKLTVLDEEASLTNLKMIGAPPGVGAPDKTLPVATPQAGAALPQNNALQMPGRGSR